MILTLPGQALAHGLGPEPTGAEAFLQAFVSCAVVTATAAYVAGWWRLVRRLGREPAAAGPFAPACFLCGQIVLSIALLSPLATSGGLFTAHMIQHVLLVALAPPLLLLGRPELFGPLGLPRAWRVNFFRARAVRAGLAALRAAGRPLPAAVLHGAALWAWHAPALFEAAERSVWLHALEHFSFFATALLFWHGVVRAKTPEAALAGAASALATLVHSGFLAALLVFSPAVLYPDATAGAPLWGLTPLEDQQLAGVVMWVPAGLVYLLAGLLLAARVIAPHPAEGTEAPATRFERQRTPTA
ncbi:MAG TPA: cytochrome c oxidase assembly protein [Mesorhizobium sp.]|nr:cytochrome c oxidase assembly protein [Mesorhizobium sp.]